MEVHAHGRQGALVGGAAEGIASLLALVCRSAVPNVVSFFLMLIPEALNMLSISHTQSEAAVAAIGMGNMVQNCFGLSIGVGLTGALDTLVSQATGAGQHELSVVYLQRSRVLVTLQLLWMVPLLCFSREWLLLLRQPREVSGLAAEYNRAAVLGLVGMFQFEANQVFLRNRGWPIVTTAVVAVTTVLHVAWCWLFIWHLRLGNEGAGWANTMTGWLQCVVSYGYLLWVAPRMGLARWPLMSLRASAFQGWVGYLRIALPNTAVLCSDWWVSEVLNIIVGWLGPEAQAAHNSVSNLQGLVLLPVGVGLRFTAAFLVGSALGENQPRKARRVAMLCVGLAGTYWLAFGALISAAPATVARIYFPQQEHVGTRSIMERLLRIFAVAGIGQTLQIVMAGVLAGLGKQGLGARIYLFSNWLVMLPLAMVFSFPCGWGIDGIWHACLVGPTVSALGLSLALYRMHFADVAAAASGKLLARAEAAAGHAVEAQPRARRSVTSGSSGPRSPPPLLRTASQGLSFRQVSHWPSEL